MNKKDMTEKMMETGTEKKHWIEPIAAAEKTSNKAGGKATKKENIMKTKIIRTEPEMNTRRRTEAATGKPYQIDGEKAMIKTGPTKMRGDTVVGE